MAKKKTIIEETIPDALGGGPDVTGDFTFDDTSADTAIDKIKAQYGGNLVKIKVYKIVTGKSQPVFCFESQEHVDEMQLQNSYGGGSYVLRFFVDGAAKHAERIEVMDKPLSAAQPSTASDIQIQMLREQSMFNRDLLMSVLGRSTPINAPTPMSEIAQMWALIHGMNPGSNSGGSFDKLIDVFTKGLEIGSSKGGGEMDWKSALLNTVKEIAPAVTQVIARANGVPLTAPAIEQPILPEQLLRQGIAMLKTKIMSGLPVGLALDWIVSNSTDVAYQPLLHFALSKSFEDIVQVDNDLANEPYNSWFRQLLAGLKDHFKEAATTEIED